MQKQPHVPGLLKRKRRSSGSCDDENQWNTEKRVREDIMFREDELENNSKELNNGRQPFSELSIMGLQSTLEDQDPSSNNEILDNPRLQVDCHVLSSHTKCDLNDSDLEYFDFSDSEDTGDESPCRALSLDLALESRTTDRKNIFDWVKEVDVWEFYHKENNDTCSRSTLFTNHPTLQPRMRSVLLEWIIEVSAVYNLHRETYYLAVDYLDRYLSNTFNIKKTQLQLIGITCLVIASKYEEIYPPKVAEFAYITDGTCSEREIIQMELTIMNSLDWRCTIITPNHWLSAYMQLVCHKKSNKKFDIMVPQYSVKSFESVAQLLDLASLDEEFLKYSYKILAVTALYLAFSKSSLEISGLTFADVKKCVEWMGAFWDTLLEENDFDVPENESLSEAEIQTIDFSHALVKHNVSTDLLHIAQTLVNMRVEKPLSSIQLLTPPSSSEKHASY